ncbi:MAG: hypothetical protein KDC34_00125 [Saprospiraceae bacterium]|nr:hypothetical protein [Saprospiraceae bacterium]
MIRFAILLICLLPFSGNAQFGFSGTYNWMNTPLENSQLALAQNPDDAFYSNSFSLGIDYWWRPEKYRVEFYPGLAFQQSTSTGYTTGTFRTNDYMFQLNINIYLFDFLSDCDCPTFSKQDPIFKRGFFIQLSPGVNLSDHQFRYSDKFVEHIDKPFSYRAGIGAGLDLGISDMLTLTPFVRHVWRFSNQWDGFLEYPPVNEINGSNIQTGDWTQWEAGLRIGLRLDE